MMTGWSRASSRTDHVQLQVSKLGLLKPSVCSNSEGWWELESNKEEEELEHDVDLSRRRFGDLKGLHEYLAHKNPPP